MKMFDECLYEQNTFLLALFMIITCNIYLSLTSTHVTVVSVEVSTEVYFYSYLTDALFYFSKFSSLCQSIYSQ